MTPVGTASHRNLAPAPRERGVALLLVLWVTALLGILLGGYVVIARTDSLQTRHLVDATRARYAAEAGIARAVFELRRADPLTRWVPDGRPYEIEFEGAKVEIAITDESGKVDINAADEAILYALFNAVAGDDMRARQLAAAVLDWRDADDLVRPEGAEEPDYEAAGLDYGPSQAGFTTIGELQQVLGMDYELYRRIEPLITVYSRMPRPNAAYASAGVIQALPGLTPQLAGQLVQQRRMMTPQQMSGTPLMLPDGTPLVAGGGGVTYTVVSRAELPNGAWTALDVTLRLGGQPARRAYTLLRWREGSADDAETDAETDPVAGR